MFRAGIILFIHVLTTFSIVLHAQTAGERRVNIQVADNKTTDKIVSAVVTDHLHNTIGLTDSTGNLQFKSGYNTSFTLFVKALGYNQQALQIAAGKDTMIHCFLQSKHELLSTVEIVSEKSDQTKKIQSYLTPQQTREQKGKILGELFEQSPGIRILRTGNNVMKPIIHGLHSNRLLIITQDTRLESQQWGSDHGVEYDSFHAHSIAIIKGPDALQFGHDALAGVIIINEKPMPTQKGVSGDLNIISRSNGRGMGSYLMLEDGGSIMNRLSLRASISYKMHGTLNTPDYGLSNTGMNELNHSCAFKYHIKKHNIEFVNNRFTSNIGIFSSSHNGNLTDLKKIIDGETIITNAPFSYSINRPSQQVLHEIQRTNLHIYLDKAWSLKLQHARQFNQRMEFDKHRPRNDSLANLNLPELNLKLTSHHLSWTLIRDLQKKTRYHIGGNYTLQKNTYTGRFYIPNFIRNAQGIYVLLNHKLRNSEISAALRYDIQKLQSYFYENKLLVERIKNFQGTSASFGVKQPITSASNLDLQLSTAWRSPGINELYSNGLHHGSASIEIGDQQLKTERSFAIQTAFTTRSDIIELNFQPYTQWISGFIYAMPQTTPTLTIRGAFPTFRFEQTNAMLWGTDLEAFYLLNEKSKLRLSGSVLRARDLRDNTFLTQMPADRIALGTEYYPLPKKYLTRTKLNLEVQYVNKQWRTPANTDLIAPPSGYTLMNASATTTLKIHKQDVMISMQITNLLNTRYRDYLNRFRYYTDEVGRNISITIHIPLNIKKNESD